MQCCELGSTPDESLAPYTLPETQLCKKSDTRRHDEECKYCSDNKTREDKYKIGHREGGKV